MSLVEKIIPLIPQISSSVNYWLLRTDAGRLYQPFIDQSLVAISYSKIKTEYLYPGTLTDKVHKEKLKKIVEEIYTDHERPGVIVSQLLRFAHEIKKGDIILIPSSSSDFLAIGEILDDEISDADIFYVNRGNKIIDENFKKSRSVKWLKKIPKKDYNAKLFQLFYSHQAIVSANDYEEWINPLLHDFFYKNDLFHLVLKVNKKDSIAARELFGACLEIFDMSDLVLEEIDTEEDSSIIDSKINLNSPGNIELIAENAPYIITAIALVVLMINGGKFTIKTSKFDFNIGTDGLIKKINSFLNSSKDRKLKETVRTQIANLDIQSSQDICNILESINEKNQNE